MHSFFVSGAGTWSVQLQWSATSCNGPWTSYGSTGLVTNSTGIPIGYGFDGATFKNFISFSITGSVSITYTGEHGLYYTPASGGGSITLPLPANSGGTGLTSITQYGIPYGNGTSPVGVTAAGTPDQVFVVPSGGNPPGFGQVNLSASAAVTGTLGIGVGGTNATTASGAFNNLSPMTTLGDLIYGGASGAGTRLAGDTSNTRKFLREQSVGGVATAEVWDTLQTGDLPQLPAVGTAGTYTKVTTDAQGRVTSGVQANFTDLAGSLQIGQTPLTTSQDILFNNGGMLGRIPISLVGPGNCLGDNAGSWGGLPCSSGGGSGTVINDVTLSSPGLVVANGGVHVTLGGIIGDVTTSGLTATLATVNLSPATCGDATHVCQIVDNGKGLVTSQTPVSISILPSGVATQVLKLQPNVGNTTTTYWAYGESDNINDLNFPAITPTGSPAITIGSNTVTIPQAPLGFSSLHLYHYLYISGGTGTPEAVLVTGGSCTALATNCTVIFNAANTHSGAYTLGSASAGLQEAIWHSCNQALSVRVPIGSYAIYAPAYIPACGIKIYGDNPMTSLLVAQSANTGVLDVGGVGDAGIVIRDLGFNTVGRVQGTVGGYAIRLGYGLSNEVAWIDISNIYCEPFYDCVVAVNASHYNITRSTFYNFSHTGITVNDNTNQDFDSAKISLNEFYNYNLSSAAIACVYIASTGAIHISDNNCQGASIINQLNAGIALVSTVSSQMTISGNTLSTFTNECIVLEGGVYNNIAITGNNCLFPSTNATNYGILINGTNTASTCVGLCQISITGNTFQGPGTSGSGVAFYFQNYVGNVMVDGNTLFNWPLGITTSQMLGSGTVTFGEQNMESVTTPFNNGSIGSGTRLINTAVTTYSNAPGAANGSMLYFSDANSTCTAGGNNGRTCFREAGSWTH